MVTLAKSTALLFLVACVVSTVRGQDEEAKIPVAPAVPMQVNYPARVAVPIQYKTLDYNGPYDPFDSKGTAAALHRRMKLAREKAGEVIKSYVPPGIGKFCKKEAIGLAMNEGRRFAVAHPKETAELVGIATKAKALYQNAAHAMKKTEEKEGEGHKHHKH